MLSTIIAQKEFRELVRHKLFPIVFCVSTLLMLVSVWGGYDSFRQQQAERRQAEEYQRMRWLQQDPKHPHIAAHFGNYAFLPKTVFSLFDAGLDTYTGSLVYLEPHKQNDFSFKPAEAGGSSVRFGMLSPSLILQSLFPLLIIFIGFDGFTAERRSSNLKMVYAQGISFSQLFWGKWLGLVYVVLLMILLPFLFFFIIGLFLSHHGEFSIGSALLLWGSYLLFLCLIIAFTLLVSAISRNRKISIVLSLCCWLVFSVLLPKWSASMGESLYPLPTKYEFTEAIRRDMEKGLNGHDSKSERAERIKTNLLAKYHVDSVSQLPFNFEGYIMQQGEDYSSMVYDHHFDLLQQKLDKQNRLSIGTGIINPYMALRDISMAICGTDFYTHLDFQKQAEQYRRHFVQMMNGDMTWYSHMGDWNYKAGKEVFRKVTPFSYSLPSLFKKLQPYCWSFCALGGWWLIIILFIQIRSHKLNRP